MGFITEYDTDCANTNQEGAYAYQELQNTTELYYK